jgi:hypothetical protein
MSLVAGFQVGAVPVLTASVAFARRGAGASTATSAIDLLATLPEEYGDDLTIRQRIAIIDDKLAIAWSGAVPAAAFVIKTLRRMSQDKPLTAASLAMFLQDLDKYKHLADLAIIGIRVEGPEHAALFGRGVQSGRFDKVAPQYFCEDAAHDYFRTVAMRAFTSVTDRNDLLNAVTLANILSSGFIRRDVNIGRQIEIASPVSMLPLCAGSYETVVFHEGRLRKLPMLTNFWRARLDEKYADIETPCLVVKREYAGNTLMLRWGWAERQSRQVILPLASQHCLAITGADDPPLPLNAEKAQWPPLTSDFECHAILATDLHGNTRVGTLTHRCVTDLERDIRFAEQPESGWTRGRLGLATAKKIATVVNGFRNAVVA